MRPLTLATLFGLALPSVALAQSDEMLRNAGNDPHTILTYGMSYSQQRFSALAQINRDNVKRLVPAWSYSMASNYGEESQPLILDGVMYVTQAPDDVVALDAKTGRAFWVYHYNPSADAKPCCGRVNRGVAMLGDTLFLATIDAHLIAIDAKNGQPVWNVKVADAAAGYAMR